MTTWTHILAIDHDRWACGMAAAIAASVKAFDPQSVSVVDLFCGGGLGAVGWDGRAWTRPQRKAVPA